MNFNLINKEEWLRKEYYKHYTENVPCTYSLTCNIDFTDLYSVLKKENIKPYAAQIYTISTTVNQYSEFRMSINANGDLGYWDQLNPSYTVFNKKTETFSSIWTEFNSSFTDFYGACSKDIEHYSSATCLKPKADEPENVFNVSCLPWVSFTGFNLNVGVNVPYLLPIFTIGKFFKEGGKTLMPVAIQAHHAVCDGFHVAKFINSLQELIISHDKWIYL